MRHLLKLIAIAAVLAAPAAAQDYPTRPVRIVVPFAAGGFNDILGRVLAEQLSTQTGQSFFVDNRTGAGGNIGTEAVVRAPADGYTLLVGSTPLVFGMLRNEKPPYDPIKDLAPISVAVATGNVLVVHPSIPARTVKELVEYLKSRPGKVSYGSSSLIGTSHLGMELFKAAAKIDVQHIPYRGSGQLISDLLTNEVSLTFDNIQFLSPYVKDGKLIAIATANLARTDMMPDVPTIAESGFPGVEVTSWVGLFAPAGTPRPIIAKLNAEIVAAVKLKSVRDKLPGADMVGSSPEQAAAHMQAELAKWQGLVKEAGIKLD